MKKILFIHRSVGQHLLKYGNLRSLIQAKGLSFDDYNNNDGVLTLDDGTKVTDAITMPDNNTNPDNLADFFAEWPSLLDEYDIVVIKSCYPNSHIKNATQLSKIKDNYQSIINAFNQHDKKLVILTTPPLRPLFTNPTEAHFANELADWLVAEAHGNIHTYNLHARYAASSGKHAGMLRPEYRRLLPWDNHPNRKAHQLAAPEIANLLINI